MAQQSKYLDQTMLVKVFEIYSTPLESEKAYDIWTDRYEFSDVYFKKWKLIFN